MAILVPNLATLRAEFNARWPNRDKRTDGWIGDLAHQEHPSGHNPDETGNAERRDADSVDEVRAIDLDKDVDPAPADELFVELDRIRRTPDLRRRLIYIIYRRKIASASNGWVWADYSGDNPHTEHGHLSGHPDHDNNTAPWGVAQEDDMPTADEIADAVAAKLVSRDIWPNGYGDAKTNPTIALGTFVRNAGRDAEAAKLGVAALRTELAKLTGADLVNEADIVAGVLAGLTPEKIAAAIPDALTQQVAEALAARLAA